MGAGLFAGSLAMTTPDPPPERPSDRATPIDLPASQALLVSGKSFPPVVPFSDDLPGPRRTFFVAPGKDNGDGSEGRPWNDLQSALCALEPGDRLRVRSGEYAGPIRVDAPCHDGSDRRPIRVLFEKNAKVKPGEGAAAFTLRRAHWNVDGLSLELGESAEPGVVIEGAGGHDVVLDHLHVADGSEAGIRIGANATRVTVGNAGISRPRLRARGPRAAGIVLEAGASRVLLANNRLQGNPGGAIRVEAPSAGGRAASDLEMRANTLRGAGVTAIFVGAADGVRIAGNTISDTPGLEGSRGVALEAVRRAVVRENHLRDCAIGVQIGSADPDGSTFRASTDVAVERNALESALPAGFAIDVEAGSRVRVVNNVLQGFAHGILVFGGPPRTAEVTVANNLVLGISEVAFVLENPAAAVLFDYNVFSTQGGTVDVEAASKTYGLAGYLTSGAMPHSRVAPAARIRFHDLARVTGVKTIDQGKALEGLDFRGSAPDLGVAEQ